MGALGEIGDPSVGPSLLPLLQDSDIDVKRCAVSVLGSLRTTEAVPALIALLAEGDASLVTLRALFHIGDPQIGAALRNHFESAEDRPGEIELCRVWQLGYCGPTML